MLATAEIGEIPVERPPSDGLDPETTAIKETRIKYFLEMHGKLRENKERGLFSNEELLGGYKTLDEQIEKRLGKRSLKDRLHRRKLISDTRKAGIKNPEQLISFIEHSTVIRHYTDLKPELLSKFIKAIDPDSEEAALQKLTSAYKRIRSMNFFPSEEDFQSERFIPIVTSLADIPNEQFKRVFDELDKYKFFYNPGLVTYENQLALVTEIMQNGGLSQEQKEKLEKMNLCYQLTNSIPIVESDRTVTSMVTLTAALENKNYLDEFWPYLMDFAYLKLIGHRTDPFVDSDFLKALVYLEENNLLDELKNLSKLGIGRLNTYISLIHDPKSLEKTLEFMKDPEKADFAKLLEASIFDRGSINPSRIDEYESYFKYKDFLEDLLYVISALPGEFYRVSFSDRIIIIKEEGPTLYLQSLNKLVNVARYSESVTPKEKRYASIVDELLRTIQLTGTKQHSSESMIEFSYLPFLAYIARNQEKFNEYFYGTQPQAKLIEDIYKDKIVLDPLLNKALLISCRDPERLPPEIAWENYSLFSNINQSNILFSLPDNFVKTLPEEEQNLLKFTQMHGWAHILIANKEAFSKHFNGDTPTPQFYYELVKLGHWELGTTMNDRILSTFPEEEKAFWEYFNKAPFDFRRLIFDFRERFPVMVKNGKETPEFLVAIIDKDEKWFVKIATREHWKTVFGEETINNLLNALPKVTDEKRNAFTHNEYDRTTEFLGYLLNSKADFYLDKENIEVLIDFVKQFGLSKSPLLFDYYKRLVLFEKGRLKLSPTVADAGLHSTAELIAQVRRIKEMVYSEKPMTNLSKLTPFEVELLRVVTGKSTHRFDPGRPQIEQIIRDFQVDFASHNIHGLPSGYKAEELNTSKVKIELNEDNIRQDYEILAKEILGTSDLLPPKEVILGVLQKKLDDIQRIVVSPGDEKKQKLLEEQTTKIMSYIAQIEKIEDQDLLMSALLEMNFDKTEQIAVTSVFRRIIFEKIFEKITPVVAAEILTSIERGIRDITAESLETLINIIDEMAKAHALNLEDDNAEGYWSDETFAKIKGTKRGRDLPHCFSPHIGKLKEEVDNFKATQVGKSEIVKAIPDRGFIGEMSGYLADVCYTHEYPLLKRFPNVIPYKFVAINESGEQEFIGSVLIFELKDTEGKNSLLVRGFDVPNESAIDIKTFIEQFLDKLAKVARERGMDQILVTSNAGAISNYQQTINHIQSKYTTHGVKTTLAENFSFNGYDITNDVYVARRIEPDEN